MTKRLFDIICSSLGLIILSPLFLVLAVLIKFDSKGPIFFKQERVGKNEKIFKIYKFRTMIDKAWVKGTSITISDKDSRITNLGKTLRKYKLDELPQLFNVFKGEMSLVGPRPEIPEYVNNYTQEQKKVLSVRPGITDIASLKYIDENKILSKTKNSQKAYANNIMPQKLDLNLKYVKNHSFFSDLTIILKTIKKCLLKK